jgi:hypothetical protein
MSRNYALNLTDPPRVAALLAQLLATGDPRAKYLSQKRKLRSTAADPAAALGYASARQLGVNSFLGIGGLAADDVVVRQTYYGDTNLDRRVNTDDILNILAAGKLDAGAPATWLEGDMNFDDRANTDDILQILAAGRLDQP